MFKDKVFRRKLSLTMRLSLDCNTYIRGAVIETDLHGKMGIASICLNSNDSDELKPYDIQIGCGRNRDR